MSGFINFNFAAKNTYWYRSMCYALIVFAVLVAFGGGFQMLSAYQYEQSTSLYPDSSVIYPVFWLTIFLVIGLLTLGMFGLLLVNIWESSQQNTEATIVLVQLIAKRNKSTPSK